MLKEVLKGGVTCGYHTRPRLTIGAAVLVLNRHAVVDVEVYEDSLQLLGRVVDKNLLVGLSVLGNRLHVVTPDTQKEEFPAIDRTPLVAVVNTECSAHHAADCIS